MDSYNFNPPIPLDSDCCSDCGILMETGSGICEYCNKRYQQEEAKEREMHNSLARECGYSFIAHPCDEFKE